MEITATCTITKSSSALELNLWEEPGERNIVILTVYGTEFETIIFPAHIPVYAAMKIEMYLLPVASYPFCFPTYSREVLRHELLHTHAID